MMVVWRMTFAYQDNLAIFPQTDYVQEHVQSSVKIGKLNVMEPLTTTETFIKDAKDKMFAMQKLRIQMEFIVQVNLILMVVHTHVQQMKFCAQQKKGH